jgi:5-deoxy-glucuronate isomerase
MRGGLRDPALTHLLARRGERLFVFEVYTPSGNWSGFPPHRHDGRMGSSALEETYYFRVSPPEGFGSIRVYTGDTGLDELMLVRDRDLVLVPEGYHPTNAAPGSNLYFLNFLAGSGTAYTVVNDPAFDWVKDDWTGRALPLPLGRGKP